MVCGGCSPHCFCLPRAKPHLLWGGRSHLHKSVLENNTGVVLRDSSDLPHEQEDDEDDEHEAEATARAVAPFVAVRPGWEGADQE